MLGTIRRFACASFILTKNLASCSIHGHRLDPVLSSTSQRLFREARLPYTTNAGNFDPWALEKGLYRQKTSDLDGRARQQVFAQALGPLSPDDLQVENRLREGASPGDALREGIAKGTGSFILKRGHLLEVQRKDSIALNTLRFLWTDEKLWVPFVLHDLRSQYNLCYYAIVEGLDDVILEWLFLAIESSRPKEWQQNVWRGSLLRSLVAASTTLGQRNAADGSIKLFFKAVEMQQRKDNGFRLSLRPASVSLYTALTNENHVGVNTDVVLYNRAVQFLKDNPMKRSAADMNYMLAGLALNHPTTPSAERAIEMLKMFDAHGADDGSVVPKLSNPKMQQAFSRFLQRTITVASSNGQLEAVAWIRQRFAKETSP